MSIEQHPASARVRWSLTRTLVASTAVVLLVGPGIAGAGAGSGTTGGVASSDAHMVADAKAVEDGVAQLYNERKWDELRALYTEDALLVAPNHEPVRGPAAIAEYLRSTRDFFGEVICGDPLRATASGRLASLVGQCSAFSGRYRFVTHEGFERQSDGVVRFAVDMFGDRDPLK
jgi:ketosteroid isomerase-like protein